MYRVHGRFIAYTCNNEAVEYRSRAMNCAADAIHLVPTTEDMFDGEKGVIHRPLQVINVHKG